MQVVTRYATCENLNCGNFGAVIPVTTEEEHQIFCGPCGFLVARIEETTPVATKEMPAWQIE